MRAFDSSKQWIWENIEYRNVKTEPEPTERSRRIPLRASFFRFNIYSGRKANEPNEEVVKRMRCQ